MAKALLTAGMTIDGFRLEERLHLGGMAAIWRVSRDDMTMPVVMKAPFLDIKGKRTAPFIDDIIVRPEFLPKFLPELNNILQKYDLIYTLAGHAGDGNFHVIPLMDLGREDASKIILNLGEEVYDLVMKYRGSITAEHNDGLIRTPYLPKMFGEKTMNIFTEIKKIFDPQNIFNPGKKIALSPEGNGAGTKEYIASHIATEHKAEHKV